MSYTPPFNITPTIVDLVSLISEVVGKLCEVSDKTIKRDIAKLKEEGRLGREGSLKSGFWKILK